VRTRHLHLVTHEHSVTVKVRSDVSSAFGPVSLGSTTLLAQETLRANQLRQLTELLNSLESVVANLNYKSSTALDTLLTATQGVRVALSATPIDAGGTKV
jgi:glycerol-3-phosphate O-acyltransferase